MKNKKSKNILPPILQQIQKEFNLKEEGVKMWVADDGIWRIKTEETWSEKGMELLVEFFKKTAKEVPIKPKILINVTSPAHIKSPLFRRKAVRLAKEAVKSLNFEKVALYGGGVVRRMVVLFITKAAGLKNIKHFKTEEEALRWLKKD